VKVLNLPNAITILRALLIPVIIVGAYSDNAAMILVAIILVLFAWIIDHFDGYIARKYNLITNFGIFFDPLVDKLLVLSMFFVFVDLDFIPIWMAILLLFREFLVTGIREVSSAKGKVIGSNWMGKAKWNLQIIIIIYTLVFLWAQSKDYTFFYGREIIYFGTFIMVSLSLVSAFVFLSWNRNLILK
jgi:CDP-diacylglycerol--glycerol-3-phosphate 3-phosphatidyltransferase